MITPEQAILILDLIYGNYMSASNFNYIGKSATMKTLYLDFYKEVEGMLKDKGYEYEPKIKEN